MKILFMNEYFSKKREEKRKKIFDFAKITVLQDLDYEMISKAYLKYSSSIIQNIPERIDFDIFTNPEVSVIIPVYNQFDLTMKCLASIKDRTSCSYEIILADDCSCDETKSIEEKVSNIKIIRNTVHLGFLKNCNQAVIEAKGKFLYFLNNDTQLMPNAMDFLLNTLSENNNCGAVGSKLIFPNGKLQSAGSEIDNYTLRPRLIGMYDNPLKSEYNQIKTVDYSCGASLMIKKNLWGTGFDEIFSPGYFEETDFCLRLKAEGYDVLYCPQSEVIHFTSQSFGYRNKELINSNFKKFKNKWKNKIRKIN